MQWTSRGEFAETSIETKHYECPILESFCPTKFVNRWSNDGSRTRATGLLVRATPVLTISCSLGGHTGRRLLVASCIGFLILDLSLRHCFNALAPIVEAAKSGVCGAGTRKYAWKGCRNMRRVNTRFLPEVRMRTELEMSDRSRLIHGIRDRLLGAKMSIVLTIRCSSSDCRRCQLLSHPSARNRIPAGSLR